MKTYKLEDLKRSILPLCQGYEKPLKSIKKTLGNALIFEYDGGIWLVTGRHLIESDWQENIIKSVLLTDQKNLFLMWKKDANLQYHPADKDRSTLGIGLYYFSKKDNFSARSLVCQWSPDYTKASLREGDALMVMGIRSEKMTPESIVSSKPNEVEQVEGTYLDNTLNISPTDYNKRLIKQQVVKVAEDSLMELSGGLVAAKHKGQWYPRGLITGTGTVTVKESRDSPAKEVGIYTYTDFMRLQEIFNIAKTQA